MPDKFILALDQGSSSTRGMALRPDGSVAARHTQALTPDYLPGGRVEYDARALLSSQMGVLHALLDRLPADASCVLGAASQRSTVVFWDKKTGEPLGPALSWQDGRARAEADAVDLPQEEFHKITGLYKTPFYSAPKIAWCVKNIPEAASAAAENRLLCGPVASYFVWHLTKGAVFAADPALAQRMMLLNIHTQDWDEALLALFGIKRAWLPQIRPTVGDWGVYTYNGRTVQIGACTGDQQAAAYASALTEGNGVINYGTGAFFLHNAGKERKLVPGLLSSLSVSDASGACDVLLEGPVNAAGNLFLWLKEIGFPFEMTELDGLCAQAKRPAQILPALGGLGAPYWDFAASPVMAGFTPQTTRADMAAGAVRGIGLLIADIVYYLKQAGVETEEIAVSGGLSHVHALVQFQADILQKSLCVYDEPENTLMGTARLAAQRAGMDTRAWRHRTLITHAEPEFFGVEAQREYRKWRAFVDWCRQKPS